MKTGNVLIGAVNNEYKINFYNRDGKKIKEIFVWYDDARSARNRAKYYMDQVQSATSFKVTKMKK